MEQIIYQVDAFTESVFSGNPAGVCIMEKAAPEIWMQNIAAEMNLSETAFLYPEKKGYNLRWFTPRVEVELCGHATLASAHILWEKELLGNYKLATFYTKSGLLIAAWENGWIKLDFPSLPPEKKDAPDGLLDALGVTAQYVGASRFDYLVEVDSGKTVEKIQPDFSAIARLPVRGVIVTGKNERGKYDFVSRFFAPAVGVNEDPVTGSAHCVLGPYWSKKLGKSELVAYQASSRGGELQIRAMGERTHLLGQARTIFEIKIWE